MLCVLFCSSNVVATKTKELTGHSPQARRRRDSDGGAGQVPEPVRRAPRRGPIETLLALGERVSGDRHGTQREHGRDSYRETRDLGRRHLRGERVAVAPAQTREGVLTRDLHPGMRDAVDAVDWVRKRDADVIREHRERRSREPQPLLPAQRCRRGRQ